MITLNNRHCSCEPELDQEYTYDTFTQRGYDAVPTTITRSGAQWAASFEKDIELNPDFSDALTEEWQEKFDDIGFAFDCVMGELDMNKIVLDRATKYLPL
jgi:hypothetical protein